jgi:HEPN domain-containing protein
MTNHDPFINDFANRSFRDLADQDYVLARGAYRYEFDQQFRWCSLQAIEKYLKAILLYNRVSSKDLGHDLNKALSRVKDVTDLEFSVPSDVEEFVDYISVYGADRYLSHPTHLKDSALLALDKSIWCIRRYCFFMRQGIRADSEEKELFELNKQKVTDPYFEEHRHKYKIFGGYLEEIVDKRLPAYHDLVW